LTHINKKGKLNELSDLLNAEEFAENLWFNDAKLKKPYRDNCIEDP